MWARSNTFVNIIGATADDARDIMVEGESGILSVCSPSERPLYKKSERKLLWPNGAVSLIFTADEPDRLRGKQHQKLWMDELASWRYEDAYDQAMLGLRLGSRPQGIATTTPRPIKLIRDLIADPMNVVTRGTTYDNRDNLALNFFTKIIRKYEGSRLGQQELEGLVLEDIIGAIFFPAVIDQFRVQSTPTLREICISVDPAVSNTEDSNETGIVAVGNAGLPDDGHIYVLEDNSGVYSPVEWATKVIKLYNKLEADCVVGEINNGGDLVEANLRACGFKGKYAKVSASRGKRVRAEPVATLYEVGRVHHFGVLAMLESQMTTWTPLAPDLASPDRMDALVWGVTYLTGGVAGGASIDFPEVP
jgi:phage terminase large subunit-like protein